MDISTKSKVTLERIKDQIASGVLTDTQIRDWVDMAYDLGYGQGRISGIDECGTKLIGALQAKAS
jgi:hypothetical protein